MQLQMCHYMCERERESERNREREREKGEIERYGLVSCFRLFQY